MSYQLTKEPLLRLVDIVGEVRGAQRRMSLGGKDPSRAVLDSLATLWPGTYPGAIATDYPREAESVDAWGRAAVCHGIVDAIDGKPPRTAPSSAARECCLTYVAIYSLVRGLMGVKA